MNTRFIPDQENSTQINNKTASTMLTPEELIEIYSEHLWIKINEQDLEEAKANTRYYANQTGHDYAFLNSLCVKLMENYVKESEGLETNHHLFYNENNLARIWQFINGSVININDKRLILIPSEATDIEGFEVEQEWVDIPGLAGDYYLPVRVDLELNYLQIWGFISRKSLKKNADYDEFERLYIVDSSDVIDDVETLWIACKICQEKGEFKPLVNLTESEAEELITNYSEPAPYSPRLKEGNFQQWMALLNQENWLKKLDLEILIKSPDRPLVIFLNEIYQKTPTEKTTKPTLAKRRGGIYQSPLSVQSKTREYRVFPVDGVILDTQEKINQAIKNLATKSVQDVVPANLESEDILLHLLLSDNKTISGQAAEIFWAIASYLPPTNKREIRTEKIELSDHPLLVNIASIQTPSKTVAILLRVCSQLENSQLPNGLTLQWIFPDDKGNFIPEGAAAIANQQNFVQLYFAADFGERCGYEIIIRGNKSREYFIV